MVGGSTSFSGILACQSLLQAHGITTSCFGEFSTLLPQQQPTAVLELKSTRAANLYRFLAKVLWLYAVFFVFIALRALITSLTVAAITRSHSYGMFRRDY